MKRSFATRIYSKKGYKKIENKFKLLGIIDTNKVDDFLNSRLILCIFIFFVLLVWSKSGFILAPLVTLITYMFFEYFYLDHRIKVRQKVLENEAIYFFEVLALTIESGRNLKGAIEVTTKAIDNEISKEFKKAISEVDMGKSLSEALDNMKRRIPSDTINNAILNITQSNIFGSSIISSLYNQIDFLREKQIQDIKTEIVKLPTKISAVSVVFFVPIMLLLILAPVVLNYILG
ncbi:MAG: type II secretion system F family protein [Bacilli bacterium]|nr:type II secretion system F family protein [Bacilli bacterium]